MHDAGASTYLFALTPDSAAHMGTTYCLVRDVELRVQLPATRVCMAWLESSAVQYGCMIAWIFDLASYFSAYIHLLRTHAVNMLHSDCPIDICMRKYGGCGCAVVQKNNADARFVCRVKCVCMPSPHPWRSQTTSHMLPGLVLTCAGGRCLRDALVPLLLLVPPRRHGPCDMMR